MFFAPDSAATNISLLCKIIFEEEPPLKDKVDPIIFLFNGDEDRISAKLRINYDIPRNFKYSLIGILLQCNKNFFVLLKKNYNLMIAYQYSNRPMVECLVSYVVVVPNKAWHGLSSECLIFPTRIGNGKLIIEEIRINGTHMKDLLEISSDGKILNPEVEKIFLTRISELNGHDR